MSQVSVQDMLTSVYVHWDLASEQEKDFIMAMDDKLNEFGGVSPSDFKGIKKLLKELKNRKD
jgi:hypothetical protein